MTEVFLLVYLAIAIPAWIIVLASEHVRGKVYKKQQAEKDAEAERWESSLRASKELTEEIRAVVKPVWVMTPKMSDFPIPAVASRKDGTEVYRRYKAWFESYRDRVLYEYGIAEDLEAIYGEDWESEAVFRMNGPVDPWLKPCVIRFKGFHDPPSGGDLSVRFPETEAMAALILSRRGILPFDPYDPKLDIIPYPRADWNREYALRWYGRIRENLIKAGVGEDLRLYWPQEGAYDVHGIYFAPVSTAGDPIEFE